MKIEVGQTYHIDCDNVKQYENERIVDDVTVIEIKPRSPYVLVHSPKLRADVLVKRDELKEVPTMYIAIMKHNSTAEGDYGARKTYAECVELIHDFFLSYDFEMRDGRPYDQGNETDSNPEEAFKVFDNIEMYEGKMAGFMHCGGEGPVAEIRESV